MMGDQRLQARDGDIGLPPVPVGLAELEDPMFVTASPAHGSSPLAVASRQRT